MILKSNKSQITFALLGQEHGRCPKRPWLSHAPRLPQNGCSTARLRWLVSCCLLPKMVQLMLTSALQRAIIPSFLTRNTRSVRSTDLPQATVLQSPVFLNFKQPSHVETTEHFSCPEEPGASPGGKVEQGEAPPSGHGSRLWVPRAIVCHYPEFQGGEWDKKKERENDITEDCVRTALRHSYIIISGAACLTCSFLPTVQPICYHCEKIQIWDRIARLNTNAQLLNLNSRYSTIFFLVCVSQILHRHAYTKIYIFYLNFKCNVNLRFLFAKCGGSFSFFFRQLS